MPRKKDSWVVREKSDMMIVMQPTASQFQISAIVDMIEQQGLGAHLLRGPVQTTIGIVGDTKRLDVELLRQLPGIERITPISHPYRLASRQFSPRDTIVTAGSLSVGEGAPVAIIAGPCSVESRQQILESAQAVREAGGHALRGGAFKPRTSPYSFQGMGEEGLELLAEARELTGLPVVTEVMAVEQVSLVQRYADVLQIGARNMQNYNLLHAVGASQHPVLLKRGMSATIDELLMSAEYVLSHGNRRVILCERGIRTYETATRNTTDINAVPVLKSLTHLPVILDPSHSTGQRDYVIPIARAAIAAGANGLIVETHPDPDHAMSDGAQSLRPEQLATLVRQARRIAETLLEEIAG
jgi:3-deoxy-7-phosphoheptulonate synthase